MSPWKSAQPGDPVSAIDTPALVLDLQAFERNLKRMADALAGSNVRLRPHAKSHKCPDDCEAPDGAGRGGYLLPESERGSRVRGGRDPRRAGDQ